MAIITAIKERSRVDLELMKQHLRLDIEDTSEDDLIEFYLLGAKDAADNYCGNPFVDADGADRPIHPCVDVWIVRKVASVYTFRESVVKSVAAVGATGAITLTQQDRDDLFPGWKPRL
jgi:uncharacterized phage protein (predicted DNA packaging)